MNTNFDVVEEPLFMEFRFNGLYRAEMFWILCAPSELGNALH
jgi:hypothetical protein